MKISESMKIKCILAVQAVLLLLCIFGLFGKDGVWHLDGAEFAKKESEEGASSGQEETITLCGKPVSLKAGVYRLELSYETDLDMENAWCVTAEDISFDGILENTCMLYSGEQEADMYIWLTEKTDSLQIQVLCAPEAQMEIHSAWIEETNLGARLFLVLFLTFFILWDIYLYRKANYPALTQDKRIVFFGLALAALASSVPLLTGYEIGGADTVYHLLRIEGVKDGLLSGQFPVRIQPGWLQGYGYATGIFYCDTFLYLPAFLRIMGFPVGAAYLIYKFLLNVLTVFLAYWSLEKIFEDRYIALFGSAVYSLNLYRLLSMYLKDHLGQYTAMTFVPVLVYAVWRLLSEDTERAEYKRIWIPLTLSATALVQCHVLTCELAVIFCLITGLVFWKRLLRRESLVQLGKALFWIVGLNLWFLLPFADYMLTQKLNITGSDVYTRTIQGYGSLLPQLFGVFSFAGGSDGDISAGMQGEIPFTVGIVLILSLFHFLYLVLCGSFGEYQDKKRKTLGIFSAVMSVLTLFMATTLFPWDAVHSLGGLAGRLVSALQYPTRLLEAAAVFLTLTGCVCLKIEREKAGPDKGSRERLSLYIGTVLILSVITTGMFYSSLLNNAGFYKIYEADSMGNAYLSGREYLPEGTKEELLKAGNLAASEGVFWEDFEKDALSVEVRCNNTGEEAGYLELPLLYYKGYQAVNPENREILKVSDGENHVVRVEIPAGYQGKIAVDFVSPWYWRVSELLTLFAWAGFLVSARPDIWRRKVRK